MECNVTSIKKKRAAAFTLVEFLVTAAISGVVLLAVAQLSFFTIRSFAALYNYIELDKYSRNALDQMVYKIRQADGLNSYSANRLVFAYNSTNTLTYLYSPDAKRLTETITTPTGSSTTRTLLTGCNLLSFSIFQRNTASGTYDQFPATLTNNAVKLVQLSWSCSRSALGTRINTESVQSAKIVIRNP
jgi:Tfp pilus assembly protein PilV